MNIRKSRGQGTFEICNVIFLILLSIAFLLPFWIVAATSFMSSVEAARRGAYVLYPETVVFDAYRALLHPNSPIFSAYRITLFRVVVGTSLNLIMTGTLAYGLSKRTLPGNGFFTAFIFFTMFFGGGLVPTYLVVKAFGLVNTVWALVIPGVIGTWNLLIMRTFFSQIPESLEESATIDGASVMRIFVTIIVPLSLPCFSTIALFSAVAHWNAWFDAAIYINNKNLLPVQSILRGMVVTMTNSDLNADMLRDNPPPAESLKSAAIMISTLPILVVYPFVQKYFVKGVMVGAIKG